MIIKTPIYQLVHVHRYKWTDGYTLYITTQYYFYHLMAIMLIAPLL